MSDVCLAVARGPLGFKKLVVVKRLRPELAEDPALVEMFSDEARLAARLNHPNVIHTYEVGQQDGTYFIAMEYLEGQPLSRAIGEARRIGRPFSHPACVRIIIGALAGLEYAHELKDYDGTSLAIVHRDISPQNIFVKYDGQTKVVDFGIAKGAFSRAKTEIGVLKGKVAYMSPEQALGEPIDQRSDIFSMGAVLWEILSGARLFSRESAGATLHQVVSATIPPLSTVAPGVDPDLETIVAKALDRRPERRYQSAREMLEALETWAAGPGRAARAEEIGQALSAMFQGVREEVREEIQKHMGMSLPGEHGYSSDPTLQVPASSDGRLPWIEVDVKAEAGRSGSDSQKLHSTSPVVRSSPAARPARRRIALMTLVVAVGLAMAWVGRLAVRHYGDVWPGPARSQRADPNTNEGPARSQRADPNANEGPLAAAAPSSASPAEAPAVALPPSSSASPPAMDEDPGHTASAKVPSLPPVPHARRIAPGWAPAASTATLDAGGRALPQPAAVSYGFLTLDTYPWTHVSEGGRALGDTPLIHVPLSPGGHVLTLENSEQGIHQTYAVTIKSAEVMTRRLGLK
jgi:serine/threonine-protein kinase